MYFDFAGPAEPVRMALAMTDQPWEDKRLTRDQFLALKPGRITILDDPVVDRSVGGARESVCCML